MLYYFFEFLENQYQIPGASLFTLNGTVKLVFPSLLNIFCATGISCDLKFLTYEICSSSLPIILIFLIKLNVYDDPSVYCKYILSFMNLIDLIIIAIIGFGIIRGYSKGLIIELSSFFGIFISFFIAGNVDNLLSNEISAFISVNSDLLNTISTN